MFTSRRCALCGKFSEQIEYDGSYVQKQDIVVRRLRELGWINLKIEQRYNAHNFVDSTAWIDIDHWYCCAEHKAEHIEDEIAPALEALLGSVAGALQSNHR